MRHCYKLSDCLHHQRAGGPCEAGRDPLHPPARTKHAASPAVPPLPALAGRSPVCLCPVLALRLPGLQDTGREGDRQRDPAPGEVEAKPDSHRWLQVGEGERERGGGQLEGNVTVPRTERGCEPVKKITAAISFRIEYNTLLGCITYIKTFLLHLTQEPPYFI